MTILFSGKAILGNGLLLSILLSAFASTAATANNIEEYSSDEYLSQQHKILKERLLPLEVIKQDDRIKVLVPAGYGFEVGQSDLSRGMRDKIKSLSRFLVHYNESQVEVYGHADSTGDFEFNKVLSGKRAGNVTSELLVNGVNPWRIKSISESNEVPRCAGDGVDALECNRRVEIDIVLDPSLFR